jgi:hypothetical protein
VVRLYPRPQTLGRSCFRARRRRTSQPPPPPNPCPPVHHSRPSPRCPFELRLSPGCTEREGVRRLRDSAPPCLHVPLNAVLPPRGRGPRPATAVASSSGSRPYRRSDLVGRREPPFRHAPLLSLCVMPKRKLSCWTKNLTPLALDLGFACPNVLDGVGFGRSPRRIWRSRNSLNSTCCRRRTPTLECWSSPSRAWGIHETIR